jgi:hypothetical protein
LSADSIFFILHVHTDSFCSKWPISRVAIDALASAMLVTIMLDAWRLVATGKTGLPWIPQSSSSAV